MEVSINPDTCVIWKIPLTENAELYFTKKYEINDFDRRFFDVIGSEKDFI